MMITKQDFRKYFSKRWKGILKLLDELCKEPDKETLHDLRLHTKKVKSLCKLLERCSESHASFSIKPVKELYHLAGDIRTAQLNLETLEKYEINDEQFEKAQQEMIEKTCTEICARRNDFSQDIKKLEKKIDSKFYDIQNKTVIAYYRNNIKELAKNLALPLNTEILHENRKVLKNLMYTLKILPDGLASQLNLNEKYIDDLQDTIGKWHDTIVTYDLLSRHGTSEISLKKLKEEEQKLLNLVSGLAIDFDKKIIGTTY